MTGGLKYAGRWAWALGLAAGIAGGGLGIAPATATAQPKDLSPSVVEGPHPGRLHVTPEDRRERLRAFRMWRLINVLDLKEAQSDKFFLTLRRCDAEEDRLNGERERLSTALRGMVTRPDTSERAVLDTMQAIREQDELLRQARVRFHAEVGNILSVRQQAKLLLFEQRFDSVLREAVFDVMVRRGGGAGGGWGPPGGWGPAGGSPPEGPSR